MTTTTYMYKVTNHVRECVSAAGRHPRIEPGTCDIEIDIDQGVAVVHVPVNQSIIQSINQSANQSIFLVWKWIISQHGIRNDTRTHQKFIETYVTCSA